jgi:hypothetical protein
MKLEEWVLLGVLGVIAFTVPILSDPYYHKEKVSVAEWIYREIDELFTGERE